MLSITTASLRAITRSPSAMIFSFIFPFIFILVFGFIGEGGGRQSFTVSFTQDSDTANRIYAFLTSPASSINVVPLPPTQDLQQALSKRTIQAVLQIEPAGQGSSYRLRMRTTSSNNDSWPQLQSLLQNILHQISDQAYPNRANYGVLAFDPKADVAQIRPYRTIDFILPGQLGFSLLSAGVFGVAFIFFNLRNTLVLKRFFATPIHKGYILMGEGLSRILFQLLTAVVIILVGHFLFGFTLVNGFGTFLSMMVLSFMGLLVFMGFGFIVSGIAKNDSTIPPFANLITLPQFLLGGTFFSVENFPAWLQPISKVMPLTHLNTALRKVAFDGASLWAVRWEMVYLLGWGLLAYLIAVRVFKWE